MADSKQYRMKFYQTSIILLVLVAIVLVFLGLTADRTSRLKVDLSRDQVYSVSPATVKILKNLKDKIDVEYYYSKKLATFQVNLLRDTTDMFEEFRRLSGGKFQYRVIDFEEAVDDFAASKADEYLRKKEEAGADESKLDELEPIPPQSPMSLFNQREQPPTPKQVRDNRARLASEIAKTSKDRTEKEAYRDLLYKEFREKYEQERQLEGISAYIYTERTGSSVQQIEMYSAIKLDYIGRQSEVILHRSMESLEYELCHALVKLTTDTKPSVAFFDGGKPAAPPFDPRNPMQRPPMSEYQGIIGALSGLFNMQETSLKEGDSIDDLVVRIKKEMARKEREARGEDPYAEEDEEKYKEIQPADYQLIRCFIVAQPQNLNERQIYEINRAVSLGIPTVFLVSPYTMDVSEAGMREGFPIQVMRPGLEEMFRKWGISLGDEMIASNEMGILNVETPVNLFGRRVMASMLRPIACVVAPWGDAINQESAYTNRVPLMVFPAAAGLKVDEDALKKNSLEHETLVHSPEESWKVKIDPFAGMGQRNPFMPSQGGGPRVLTEEDLVQRKNPESFRDFMPETPLAVALKGKFPFVYEGESVPSWPKEAKEPGGGDDDAGDWSQVLDADDPLPAEEASGPEAADAADPAEAEPGTMPFAVEETGAAEAGGTAAPAAEPAGAEAGAVEPAEPAGAEAGAIAPAEPAGAEAAAPPAPAPAAAPEEAAEKAHLEPVEGRVIVLSSVDMLKDQFLRYNRQFQGYQMNAEFINNIVDLFGLDDSLAQIRRKTISSPRFKSDTKNTVRWIQAVNLYLVPLVIALIGLGRLVWRRQASESYERDFIRRQQSS
ncbi:MAG: Gldg family protein [Planctomycetes bacterium]|nr:Gldg family protein [Planctomycetota bacterium]